MGLSHGDMPRQRTRASLLHGDMIVDDVSGKIFPVP
jgi:hypothetical protein